MRLLAGSAMVTDRKEGVLQSPNNCTFLTLPLSCSVVQALTSNMKLYVEEEASSIFNREVCPQLTKITFTFLPALCDVFIQGKLTLALDPTEVNQPAVS